MIQNRELRDAPLPASLAKDLGAVWRYLAAGADPRRGCVLFCFGSMHLGIARRAAALYARGLAPWVLVTGGDPGRLDPHPTEADAYAHVLVEHGVPEGRIVIERRAVHTGENVALGMAALAGRGIRVRRAGLVAWPTSLRRCVATFARQFPGIGTNPVLAFDGLGPYARTPSRAVSSVLAELARLRDYPRRGYTVPQRIPRGIERAERRLRAYAPLPAAR